MSYRNKGIPENIRNRSNRIINIPWMFNYYGGISNNSIRKKLKHLYYEKNGIEFDLGVIFVDEEETADYSFVQKALDELTHEEKEYLIRRYYMGYTLEQVKEFFNRNDVKKVERYINKILMKLSRIISGEVKRKFKEAVKENEHELKCGVCQHKNPEAIEEFVRLNRNGRRYGSMLREVEEEFGIELVLGTFVKHCKDFIGMQ